MINFLLKIFGYKLIKIKSIETIKNDNNLPAPLIRYAIKSWGSSKPEPFINPEIKPTKLNPFNKGE